MSGTVALVSGGVAWHPDCWRAGHRAPGATYDAALSRWPRGKACGFCGGRTPASRPAELPERELAFLVARMPADATQEQVLAAVAQRALDAGHSSTTAATWAAAAGELFARLKACGGQLPDPK